MNLEYISDLVNFMHQTYLNLWYNNTLPLRFSKAVRENDDFRLSEKMVQALWNDRKFLKTKLLDNKGNPLKIHSPGTWNREPGPDFKKAVIEIQGKKIIGDVEIHLTPRHWKSHGHHLDPHYQNVVLHVVWELNNNPYPENIPHLELSSQLAYPPEKVFELTDLSNYSKAHIHPNAGCSEIINSIADNSLQKVFRAAGLSRLHRKSCQFQLKVTKHGIREAFYMSLADAHGYKSNREAFTSLTAAAPASHLEKLSNNHQRKAYLWGASNLLPDPTQTEIHSELQSETSKLWATWWKLRSRADSDIKWSRRSQHPLNSPERRLSALILLMEKTSYKPEIILSETIKRIEETKELKKYLDDLFNFDSEWSQFCNFKSRLKKKSALIGNYRKLDIIINVILPAAAALINEDKNKTFALYDFYCKLPKSQMNHILDIARHKFFIPPSRSKRIIKKAADQQGLMQLMQDFNIPHEAEDVISFWQELGINISEKPNSTLIV